jgi:2-oxoglutarate ferredoxin oxidoreductase subunit delta
MSKWIDVSEDFIIVNKDKCTGCGSCVTICGGDVFEIRENKAVLANLEGCLECGNCEIVCPVNAITVSIPSGGTGIIYECG